MDGCGFPARPQTHGHFSQASPERDSNFDQNYKPCDSTCSGVELSLLVDSSSSRLGIFLRERNATKKSREEGFWRYAVRKDFWDGRRSIFQKGQNKYNQRRPYLPVLSGKNEAFSGFWDSLWDFSLGYPR